MSNMNLPEWTAQALVAAGAVFLLISAYVMGVMVPNGLLAPNDFDVNYYFEGDIKTFDLDIETGTGVFVDDVGSGQIAQDFEESASMNASPLCSASPTPSISTAEFQLVPELADLETTMFRLSLLSVRVHDM